MNPGPVRILGAAAAAARTAQHASEPFKRDWPLHDVQGSRALEAAAHARHPEPALMARAGLATARLARAMAPHASRTLVLAGPGNNGGDGLVAARWLHTLRHPVTVLLLGPSGALPPDAAQAFRAAAACGVDIRPFAPAAWPALGAQDLLIDALLGIGSSRAPQGPLADAIALANRSPALRLAVDIPSGLHPDTGALLGTEAVHADATLALLSIKPGCVTAEGRQTCGELWWDDLGQGDLWAGVPPFAVLGGGPPHLPRQAQAHAGHKGRFGDVWVLGGDAGMQGALVLAAGAALAAGAGRVHAAPLAAAATGTGASLRAELMLRQPAQALVPAVLEAAVLVAGCGGGPAVEAALPALLDRSRRLLLDADALNALARAQPLQPALRQRARLGMQTVLTPHPLEAARLLGCSTTQVQQDRWRAVRALAERFQALVVLKGSGSLIASPGEPPWANPSGNAALASPGTGDVLAGLIAGLWAQGMDAADAARAGVWQHGAAADRWRAAGHAGALRAADLVEQLAKA